MQEKHYPYTQYCTGVKDSVRGPRGLLPHGRDIKTNEV